MIESAAIAGDSSRVLVREIAQCIVTEEISCSVGSIHNPVCVQHDSIICFQFVDGSRVRRKAEHREPRRIETERHTGMRSRPPQHSSQMLYHRVRIRRSTVAHRIDRPAWPRRDLGLLVA